MTIKIFISLLYSISFFSAFSQVDYSFSKIDSYIKNAPKIEDGNLIPLYKYINQKSENELETARAIYRWIITNISYDEEAYNNGNRRINHNNSDIINRKKAVCWGYANLFQEMAQTVGLKSLVISGYARDQLSEPFDLEEVNHAWNIIKIVEKWYLLDATWDSGLIGKSSQFTQKYQRDYFLTDPKYFLLNHLPANPIWQLLDCPIHLEQTKLSTDSLLKTISQSTCDFRSNQITDFLKLNQEEQRFREAVSTYDFNSTNSNKHHLGNAFIDYHNYLDEKLMPFQEASQLDSILILQKAMINCCEQADLMTKLLDKQQENCAYNYLNYAIALLSFKEENAEELILKNIQQAKNILEKLPSNFLIQQGLKRCEQVIEYLNQ